MKFIVYELVTALHQEYTTTDDVKNVAVIRPHLYRKGLPAGSVKLQIQDLSGEVIAESDTRLISSLGSGTYWHGVAKFTIAANLSPLTTYRIALIGVGYTYGGSAYVGWVNGFGLGRYASTHSGYDAPLDLEIWTRKQLPKGVY